MTPLRLLPAALAALALHAAPAAQAGEVMDRIIETKTLHIGVRTDAPPFAYIQDNKLKGFSAELCALMAGTILETSKIDSLDAEIQPVTAEDRFDKLASGEIDLLCGATTSTLARRETMSFTIPIFSTGIGALVSTDAPALLQEVLLAGGPAALSPNAIREALKGRKIGVRAGASAETWVKESVLPELEGAEMVSVETHDAGEAGVRDGSIDVYFADKAILAGLLMGADQGGVAVSPATFTHEPYALAIPRGDEDLRLTLDRALSHLYRTGAIFSIFQRHFGEPGQAELLFYANAALPE